MMPTDTSQLAPRARLVHRLTGAEGFALTGIAPAAPSDHADWVRHWLDAGRHGEMHYLANHLDLRLDPARLLPGAQAVIVVADFYEGRDRATEGPSDQGGDGAAASDPSVPGSLGRSVPSPTGRIARYARGDDYHKVMTKRLHRIADQLREQFPDEQFKCTVDTAPILEREHAERAGLGWGGKHTLLIHPRLGSWMLLGTIVTTLKLQTSAEADYPGDLVPPTDHCGTCTRCIDACPTQCIADPSAPGSETGHRTIDATRCISYLTLEHRSLIAPSLHASMGDWLAGCDVCQQVCPFNQRSGGRSQKSGGGSQRSNGGGPSPPSTPALSESASEGRDSAIPPPTTTSPHPRYAPREQLAAGLPLLEVLGWTVEDRQEAFRGSALKRVKLDMLKRNALIAAGNALIERDDPTLRRRIETLAADENEPELVRHTAQQVLDRLARH